MSSNSYAPKSASRIEIEQKWSMIESHNAAIDRLLAKDTFTPYDACDLQHLQQRRNEIMKTFPPIRKVVDNT